MRTIRTALLWSVLLLLPSLAFAQAGTVSGRVTDARSGEGIPGANVVLQGTAAGAAADIDGNYRFNAPTGAYTIAVTAVGYRRAEQAVTIASGSTQAVNFRLAEDAAGLDEIVVTSGYGGALERRNLSTSVVSVNAEQLRSLPPTSADAALQGRAAGVTVLQSSGTPGGGVAVRVRGSTSVSGSNQPLYVVDGVPVSSGNFSSLGAGNQGTNALATIDPSEIADIQILKDAAATAIYGTRASNGVVLITTRRGQQGRTQVEFESSLGSSRFQQTPNLLSGNEYVIVQRQAIRNQTNPGVAPAYPTAAITSTAYLPTDTLNNQTYDYWDAVTQTGNLQTYRLNVSGGTAATRYRVGGSYSDETGAVIRSGFERYNGSVNVDHRWSQKGTLYAKASYNRSTNARVGNDNYIYGVLTNALLAKPFRSIYQDDGISYSTLGAPFSNPVAEAQTTFNTIDTKFLGNVDMGYEIFKGFSVRGSAGLDRFDLRENRFAQSFTSQGSPNGSGSNFNTFFQNVILGATATYRPTFKTDDHDLQLLAGVSQEDTRTETASATGTNYPLDETFQISSASTTTGSTTATRSGLRSYFTSGDYSFRNRYLATASLRVDGSSRFGANNRYGVFPAFSLGWNVIEESFMQSIRRAAKVDLLKIRGSYGITGQQEIGNFTRLGLFGTGGSYNGIPTLSPTQLANPDLRWESTKQLSAALDFVLFTGRVGGTFEAYKKDTDDLLLAALVPLTTGYGNIQRNVGSITNAGVEFQLNTRNIDRGGFRWETAWNIATNRNKVVKLYDGDGDGIGDPIDAGFASRLEEGHPIGAFYGYIVDGLYQNAGDICPFVAGETEAARGARCLAAGKAFQNATAVNTTTGTVNPSGTYVGDRKFRDIGRFNPTTGKQEMVPDGLINAADRTFIGNPNPDFFGGITNTFTFKGVELSGFLQYSVGNDVYNNSKAFLEQSYRTSGTLLNAYTSTNTDTDVARVTTNNANTNSRASTYLVEDGSYIRLKTLTVAYSVPTRLIREVRAQGLRLYLTGTNLWTSSKYSGLDPEVSTFDRSNTAFGTDFFTYPQATTYTLGARLTF